MVCLFNPVLIFVKRIIFSLLSDLHVQYHIFFQRRLFGRSSDSVWPRKLLLSLARHRPPTHPTALPSSASLCTPANTPASTPPTYHPKCTIGLASLPLGLSGRTLKFCFYMNLILKDSWSVIKISRFFWQCGGAVGLVAHGGWAAVGRELQGDSHSKFSVGDAHTG